MQDLENVLSNVNSIKDLEGLLPPLCRRKVPALILDVRRYARCGHFACSSS